MPFEKHALCGCAARCSMRLVKDDAEETSRFCGWSFLQQLLIATSLRPGACSDWRESQAVGVPVSSMWARLQGCLRCAAGHLSQCYFKVPPKVSGREALAITAQVPLEIRRAVFTALASGALCASSGKRSVKRPGLLCLGNSTRLSTQGG